MLIKVRVNPSSSKEEIKKTNGEYLINLKDRAEDNKANIGLIKLLKKYFKKEIKIKSGFNSRRKIIELT